MASYEFPSSSKNASVESTSTTNKVNSNDSNAPLTNGEAKKQIESVKKVLKDKAEKEKKENEKEKKEREKREKERKEKLDKIWNGVKGGFSKVTDNVSDVGEDVAQDVTQEVFGSGLFATQMNNALSKALRGISESLKKITSFITTSISKAWSWLKSAVKKFRSIFSRNGLFGTLSIYFRWMRMKLTTGFNKLWKLLESIKLFSFIGKLIGGVGSAIKGTVVAAGDLIKSLVTSLLGSAAGKALLSGMSSLAATLKGITLSSLLTAIAKAFAITLPLTLSGDDPSKYYIEEATKKYRNGQITFDEYKKELSHWGTTPELQTEEGKGEYNNTHKSFNDIYQDKSIRDAKWNELIKEYPNYMRKVAKKGWFDTDANKDGIMDNPSYSEFMQVIDGIQKGDGGVYKKLIDDKAREELKNKSKLKNIAGVSST